MDIKIKTPVQIFINDKFFCIADEVEVKRNDSRFKKGLISDNITTGTVVNIKRKIRTRKEKEEVEKEKSEKGYDGFFRKMVKASKNPQKHLPLDMSDI